MDSGYSSPCQINLSAGYAEAFRPVQSDSQTSEWYSYFENDVLDPAVISTGQSKAQKCVHLLYLFFTLNLLDQFCCIQHILQ